jgi:glycosyltransferase involved in cell wall biosynthesis
MFKILNITVFSPLYPPHIGGLENHAQQFNRVMAAEGHRITVFTPLVTPQTAQSETDGDNILVLRFPSFEIIPNYPVPKIWRPAFWILLKKSLSPQPDIIISRTRFFLTSPLALVVSKLLRIPWLHIEHGSDHVHLNNPFAQMIAYLYDHVFGRLVFLTADALVANSKASAAFVKKFVPRRQVTVIYRGVDTEAINKIPPANLASIFNLQSSSTVIIYRGRLIEGKGVHILLQALSEIKDLPLHCLIVGDGPQAKNLKKQAQDLNLADIVTFTGALPWETSIAMLKAADIAVNPSFNEGLPTSIIESVFCKKAIIASDVGGTNEVISSDIAILIKPNHPQRLAHQIHHLINNTNLRISLGNNAYNKSCQKFTWKQAIPKYLSLLTHLQS